MNRDEYHEYLTSQEWQARRQWKLDEAGRRCQVCNSEHRINVHHRTYERVGRERQSDLVVLCERCHARFHGKQERMSDAIEEQIIERFAAEIDAERRVERP